MVGIFTGLGTGMERSSAMVLGSRGMFGQAGLGRGLDNVYVNAASGNLLIQNTDEILLGLSPGSAISRSYNSQAVAIDDNGDHWRPGAARKVYGWSGGTETATSTVKRVDWDGSETVYTYNTTLGLYVSTDGSGAYDTIKRNATDWTWTDGDSRVVEVYDRTFDATEDGRLVSSTDRDGNHRDFDYNAGGHLIRVKTLTATLAEEKVELVYSGNDLLRLETTYKDPNGNTVMRTRVHYSYAAGRLSSVTVDLSPEDNSIADEAASSTVNTTYVTSYGYDANGRVNLITQTDNSSMAFTYTAAGKVETVTQTVDGVSRTTTFDYVTAGAGKTTVIDAVGQSTILTYNAGGQLTRVDAPPAHAGAMAQAIVIAYTASGDVANYTPATGGMVSYAYDANGNLLSQRDSLNNTVTWTYDVRTRPERQA